MTDEQHLGQPQPGQQLPEWDKDLPERVKGFNSELIPLLGKYELGLAAFPVITPNGTIVANPTIFSDRKPPEGQEAKKPEATPTGNGKTTADAGLAKVE